MFRIIVNELSQEAILIKDFMNWQMLCCEVVLDEKKIIREGKRSAVPIVYYGSKNMNNMKRISTGFFETVEYIKNNGLELC